MARIFITGSSDGLGILAAKSLIAKGHKVLLHSRSEARGKEALKNATGAEGFVIGDLSSIEEIKQLAKAVNASGKMDAIIHNAGLYSPSGKDILTVNVLAPYILTCLIEKPKRLIYVSSGMHLGGHPKLGNLKIHADRISYSDSKLHLLMLCKAIARKWNTVYSNTIDPGWVPTKMGGKNATDNLEKGYETQVWLSESEDDKVKVSGRYFFHQKEPRYNTEADDITLQEELLRLCGEITGVSLPE